jgi:hypothetical protein
MSRFPEGIIEAYYKNRTYGVDSEYVPLWADSLAAVNAVGAHKPLLGTEDALEYWLEAKARTDRAGVKLEN